MNDSEAFLDWLVQSSRSIACEGLNPTENLLPCSTNDQSTPILTKSSVTGQMSDDIEPYELHHSDQKHFPETQLKMMNSKERRQLRNKISARNFRNRRKEYVSTLEDQVKKYKDENNELLLENKWIRTAMETLQKENDQLRLDLLLCQDGARPVQVAPTLVPSISSNLTPPSGVSTYPSSLTSNPSPPFYPEQNDRLDWAISHNTYLSHAVIPGWDMSEILKKEKEPAQPSILTKYPLLGPALMSIVVSHSLTMATDEFLGHSRLSHSSPPPTSQQLSGVKQTLGPGLGVGIHPRMLTPNVSKHNDVQALCDLLFHSKNPIMVTPADQEKEPEIVVEKATSSELYDAPVSGFKAHCPFYWLQRQLCRFVINYVAVQYPQLENSCRKYLPICDRFRRQVAA